MNRVDSLHPKFRWGYIGSGNIAASTARSILRGAHEITAVYSRNAKKAEAFAKKVGARVYQSAEDLLTSGEIDALYIATPHTVHVSYAVLALEHKIPVLCEKPVGVSLADVETLIDCAKRNETYFAEAMWTWFSDVARTVREWVHAGKIGAVQSVNIYYAFPGLQMPKDSRVRTPETAGGALLDIGIYPITYCCNLFGAPDEIHCNGELRDGIDVRETVELRYQSREFGNFRCTLHMGLIGLRESCVIRGSRGEITLPGFFHMASKAVLKCDTGKQTFRGKTDYRTEFTRAAEEIRAGKTQSDFVPLQKTWECMRVMDICRRQMGLYYPFEAEKGLPPTAWEKLNLYIEGLQDAENADLPEDSEIAEQYVRLKAGASEAIAKGQSTLASYLDTYPQLSEKSRGILWHIVTH